MRSIYMGCEWYPGLPTNARPSVLCRRCGCAAMACTARRLILLIARTYRSWTCRHGRGLVDVFVDGLVSALLKCVLAPLSRTTSVVALTQSQSQSARCLHACTQYPALTSRLTLQDNALKGPFPLNRTNRLASIVRIRNNYFSGALPVDVNFLANLVMLDVSNNSCVPPSPLRPRPYTHWPKQSAIARLLWKGCPDLIGGVAASSYGRTGLPHPPPRKGSVPCGAGWCRRAG